VRNNENLTLDWMKWSDSLSRSSVLYFESSKPSCNVHLRHLWYSANQPLEFQIKHPETEHQNGVDICEKLVLNEFPIKTFESAIILSGKSRSLQHHLSCSLLSLATFTWHLQTLAESYVKTLQTQSAFSL